MGQPQSSLGACMPGLPLHPPFPPMEAARAERLPQGDWLYEPKWDGFRALIFRDGGRIFIQSKAGQPLARYFPEIAAAAAGLSESCFVLDGEIVIEKEGGLSFDDLLLRVHPAASRIRKLAAETPASFFAFDLLARAGENLTQLPMAQRRMQLEKFFNAIGADTRLKLSPATVDASVASRWFQDFGRMGLDGIMAKKREASYHSGKRDAMVKVKLLRTADCVVGGVRYQQGTRRIGALLLGLYNEQGLLNHVGMCSSLRNEERERIEQLIAPLVGGAGFTGKAPGGPSRWSHGRSMEYVSLAPQLVCEVRYDYFNQGRFRHGTKFLRWRPEKDPHSCTYEQLR